MRACLALAARFGLSPFASVDMSIHPINESFGQNTDGQEVSGGITSDDGIIEGRLGGARRTRRSCLSAPSFSIFETLMAGWVTAPGRATITAMICAADPEGRRAHDAYHRFIRAGRWSTNALWKVLVVHVVAVLAPEGTLVVDCDDTLYKKSGRKVDGAGSFRDALRSTRKKVVYATGLNLVVVTLAVRAPSGAQPIGVPVGVRLHRKGGPTTLDLAQEIVIELASWLSERPFSLCADGAYASLARRGLPRTALTSRMRRDAALYQAAPPRTGKPGRPRKKGKRLEGPEEMATKLQDDQFAAVRVDFRGTERDLSCGPGRCCGTRRTPTTSCLSSSWVIQVASCATTSSSRPTSRRPLETSPRSMPAAGRSSA